MKCRLTEEQLLCLVGRQLKNTWGGYGFLDQEMDQLHAAVKRTEMCFRAVSSPYYWHGDDVTFEVEHSVQYMTFLYYFSNELYKAGKTEAASYVYYLNKIMNGVELFYAIELPEHFCAEHPLGTVLGRASYGDHFFFYQGVTVGGNRKNGALQYPTIGDHVTMYSNSKVLGDSHIGEHVVIAANAYIKDMNVPSHTVVFGQYPDLVMKRLDPEKERMYNDLFWKRVQKYI